MLAGGTVRALLFERLRWGEDFFPGTPPDIVLEPEAWTTTGDAITFAVLGDNGTGGRNQMDVARQMACAVAGRAGRLRLVQLGVHVG